MSTAGFGVPIDVNDRNGNPIHIGDTLEFDAHEWWQVYVGCKAPQAPQFTITIERGELTMLGGGAEDLENWCTIVRKWNEQP